MSKKGGLNHRLRYRREFKLEAARLARARQEATVIAPACSGWCPSRL